MSTSLTDPALGTEAAAPSVEDQAPAAATEVVEGSVNGENSVPVARFNGLMSSFNKVQNEKTALETQLSELRSELAKPAPTKEITPTMSDDVLSEVQQLRQMLMEERLNGARRAALDEFPDAKPFADLIVADTAEDMRDLARVISERLQASKAPATSTEAPAEGEAATEAESGGTKQVVAAVEPVVEAPVTGGGSGYVQEAAVEDRVAESVRKRSFSDFLTAKWEAADSGQTLEAVAS